MPYKHDPNDPSWLAHVTKYRSLMHSLDENLSLLVVKYVFDTVGHDPDRVRQLVKEDPHLNNVPLSRWDALAKSLTNLLPYATYDEDTKVWTRPTPCTARHSLSTAVCLLKETARYMTEQEDSLWPTPASPPSSPATSAPSKSPASSSTVPSPTISPSPSDPPPSPSKPT